MSDPISTFAPAITSHFDGAALPMPAAGWPGSDEPTSITYGELRHIYRTFNAELFDGQLPDCLFTLQREKRTMGYFSGNRFATREGKVTDEIAINPEYFAVTPVLETFQTIAHEMCHLWQAHFGTPGRGRYHNDEWACKMESIGLMPSSTGQPGGKRTGDRIADYTLPDGRLAKLVTKMMEAGFRGVTWHDRNTALPIDRLPTVTAYQTIAGSMETTAMPIEMDNDTDVPEGTTQATASPLYIAHCPGGVPSMALEIPGQHGVPVNAQMANRSLRAKYSCPECGLNAWAKPGARFACLTCDKAMLPS